MYSKIQSLQNFKRLNHEYTTSKKTLNSENIFDIRNLDWLIVLFTWKDEFYVYLWEPISLQKSMFTLSLQRFIYDSLPIMK